MKEYMKKVQDVDSFVNGLISEIEKMDRLHSKKIRSNISYLREHFKSDFNELAGLINQYFISMDLSIIHVVYDYLKMIKDMRIEGLYFYRFGKYRCANQGDAYNYVYSKPEIMSYYMNALLISQILWKHHFSVFVFFKHTLAKLVHFKSDVSILDVGPGHGFFSYLVKKEFPDYVNIDIVDISETSLQMTNRIIGEDEGRIRYMRKDILNFEELKKYDIILIGEVIEHLDAPKAILEKLASLLKPDGHLWLTTPTNAPAIDHVYLFGSRNDVFEIVKESGLEIVEWCSYFAEDVDEITAKKNKITELIGIFSKKIN